MLQMRHRIPAILASLLFVALSAPVAQAADVSVQGGTLRYEGGSLANDVTITMQQPDRFRVSDSRTDVNAGAGCTQDGARRATCASAGVTGIHLDLAGDNDRAEIGRGVVLGATILGAGGSDVLRGGPAGDRIEGGPDGDTIETGAGDDAALGGDGNDTFDEGRARNGADMFSGGNGRDTIGLGRRTGDLNVSLDDVQNDGEAGENDNVGRDVEIVRGGLGNDTLTGSDVGNRLEGGPGGDSLDGRAGVDSLHAGPGADRVGSRDLSRDEVDCGSDTDGDVGDLKDRIARDCEVVDLRAPITIRRLSSRLTPTGFVRFRVSCGSTAFGPCRGRVFVRSLGRLNTRLGPRRIRIGSRGFNVDPGTDEVVRVRARHAARRLIRRRARLVRASVRGGDSAGPAFGVLRVFVLRRAAG